MIVGLLLCNHYALLFTRMVYTMDCWQRLLISCSSIPNTAITIAQSPTIDPPGRESTEKLLHIQPGIISMQLPQLLGMADSGETVAVDELL